MSAPRGSTGAAAATPAAGGGIAFPVVGIGMSAGGLEAATALIQALPPDTGMAFVIVQHLEPTHASVLAALLGKHTAMPVLDIEDGRLVEPNHVYVIIPAKTLRIEDGRLRLTEPEEARGQRHPIDHFFTSLAKDRRERAIAVILSGAGSNGTAGIQDIKLAGGLCVAQEPRSAAFDSMPRNAIASGAVDYVLAPEAMPAAIIRYSRHPYVVTGETPEPAPTAPPAEFADVVTLLHARGHDFRQYKQTTLLRRTQRRMGLAGIEQLDAYVARLRADSAEVTELARDMMICVTGFFRDAEAWDSLDREVIQPLVDQAEPKQQIRAWVPACATGEEAYSLAMLLAERTEAAGKELGVKIFATDAAERNLGHARRGVYPASMVERLSPERLRRFFDHEGDHYRIKPAIRETVLFAAQNLLSDPPYSKMDLVSCRNLLIYLGPASQERVLALAHFALREDGYLFLGNAETIGRRDLLFTTISKRWRIYRRIGAARSYAADFAAWPTQDVAEKGATRSNSLANLALRALAEQFAPAFVVIDGNCRIHHFHGRTEEWLTQPSGAPTLDLITLARDGLRIALRRVVRDVAQTGKTATADIRRGPGGGQVRITATPLKAREGGEGLILVSFAASEDRRKPTPAQRSTAAPQAERNFEEEIKSARDDLQDAIEQYETANEELKAANEEVTSINEELQATNEELEASKEELQSLNEELSAVNLQLERKVAELEESGDDLRNLLAGNDIATIFLDTRMRIKWFTPSIKALFDLMESDIGRPIDHFAQRFTQGALLTNAKAAMDRLATSEEEVRTEDGKVFSLRVQPYRTRDNRISGAVASFIDITPLVRTRADIAAARDFAEAIVRTVRDPLLVLTLELRVVSANPAFYRLFGMRPADVEGRNFFEMNGSRWDTPRLRKLLLDILPAKGAIDDFEIEQEFPEIGKRTILNNARLITEIDGRPGLILLAKEDITERKAAERHSGLLLDELNHRVKNTLAVIQGIASQTLRRSDSLEMFREAFMGRLQALSRSHETLFESGFKPVPLGRVVERALQPFRSSGAFEIKEGPVLELEPLMSQSLTMILHEMATNAAKYGALSEPSGRVHLDWRVLGDGGSRRVMLSWIESGGPRVRKPTREGHGTRFIQRSAEYELRGSATLDYDPAGLQVRLVIAMTSQGEAGDGAALTGK